MKKFILNELDVPEYITKRDEVEFAMLQRAQEILERYRPCFCDEKVRKNHLRPFIHNFSTTNVTIQWKGYWAYVSFAEGFIDVPTYVFMGNDWQSWVDQQIENHQTAKVNEEKVRKENKEKEERKLFEHLKLKYEGLGSK